jgi:hypothetical protein
MTAAEMTRRPAIRLTFLLTISLGIAAPTSALPSDLSELDADAPLDAKALPGSSSRDLPAAPAPAAAVEPARAADFLIVATASAARRRVGARQCAARAEAGTGRAPATFACRHHHWRRSEFWNFCRPIQQGGAALETRRGLSRLDVAFSARPRGDVGARSADRDSEPAATWRRRGRAVACAGRERCADPGARRPAAAKWRPALANKKTPGGEPPGAISLASIV